MPELNSPENGLMTRSQQAEVFNNRGRSLHELKRFEEALESYEKALLMCPDYAEAFNNRGRALQELRCFEKALESYEKALVIRPDYAEAFNNRGNALQSLNRFQEALESYDKALALRSNYAEAFNNRGNALTNQGKLDQAIVAYRRAIDIRPSFAEAYSNLALCLHYHDQATAADVFVVHREWNERFGHKVSRPTTYANGPEPGRRLKIGYVSPDFRQHSVASFIERLLANHNRQAVDVFCYADVTRPDATTARLQGYTDHWLLTVEISDDDLAERIRTDGIDILVDLAGHTARNRLGVFARKPAPVQVTWLGYPDTTGLNTIDYRIVDAVTDPDEQPCAWASETLIKLEGGFLCYSGCKDAPQPAVPPCCVGGTVTFGSFNNPAKISNLTLDAWCKLLGRLPRSRLLLKGRSFGDVATRASFLSRLVERGVAAERVVLVAWLHSGLGHLGLYSRVDIALDPFPYNGTTTTCEALWMGVPVVTLRGDRHAGRVGASLLTQVGQTDWIARSVDEYVEIAVKLAGDPYMLSDLRATLRARLNASALCDGSVFARKMEAAYRTVWRSWCKTGNSSVV